MRRGDQVKVIRGNWAGAEGVVLRVLPKKNRVVVEGVNMRKHHTRPTEANPEGLSVAFLPKQINNPYFTTAQAGSGAATEEFGGDFTATGPSDATAQSGTMA